MILIEKSKTGQLVPYKFGEGIASMSLEKKIFSLGSVKEDVVWWLFEMKDLVGEISRGMYIWTKDKYVEVIGKLSIPEIKKKIFLRLANAEKDKKEEDSKAKRLGFNPEVFLSFIFVFFYISL